MNRSYFTGLECSSCRASHSPDIVQTVCTSCGSALVAVYDLDAARRGLDRARLDSRQGTLWRYRELLPVFDDQAITSLGEGWTPLVPLPRLGTEIGAPGAMLKEEGYNPTGSFKARGISVAVSKARELGIGAVCMPSAGNAGGALAAYAARAGMKAHVFVPADTPAVNIREVGFFGGEVYPVVGVISDAAKVMGERKKGTAWFDMSTMKEPYRLEGKKTMGYELAEQLEWSLPDVIIYPTGGGTGLIGMWKAFAEMERLEWIRGKKPRMISVQMTGCAPIVKAFQEGRKSSEFWEGATTVASGLRVPRAFADTLILEALRESGGTAVAVTDEDAVAMMTRAARAEGIFLSPEGAAALAAVPRLLASGTLSGTEEVLVFNTGSGYKYREISGV